MVSREPAVLVRSRSIKDNVGLFCTLFVDRYLYLLTQKDNVVSREPAVLVRSRSIKDNVGLFCTLFVDRYLRLLTHNKIA